MIGKTLFWHISFQVARTILLIFVVFIGLMIVLDFTQLARWIGSPDLGFQTAILLSILRAPGLAETVLPFAVLFGSMIAFVRLNRRLELTVTRAAGLSAWQFLIPASAAALALGLIAVTIYNPAAASLREYSVSISGVGPNALGFDTGGEVWIRQGTGTGTSLMGADRTADEGTLLVDVTAFVFDADGDLTQRIDAERARLVEDEWVMENAVSTTIGDPPLSLDEYRLQTNLSLAEIKESLADPDTVPFWRLPSLIQIATATSLPAHGLQLRFHTLLALPVLLVAMVLIAAAASLRFSRALRLGRLIVTGAASGFVLYVVLVVSRDLGRGGIVSPAIAAWAPVILALLASLTVLLREEDG